VPTDNDFSAWPLFVCNLGPYEPGQPEALMRGFDEALARGERFASIIENQGIASIPPASERKKITAWMTRPEFQERQGRLNLASATIIRSAVARGVVTAFTWVWTPPTPQLYPATLLEAAEWCVGRLEEEGVPLSLATRRYLERLRGAEASSGTG